MPKARLTLKIRDIFRGFLKTQLPDFFLGVIFICCVKGTKSHILREIMGVFIRAGFPVDVAEGGPGALFGRHPHCSHLTTITQLSTYTIDYKKYRKLPLKRNWRDLCLREA